MAPRRPKINKGPDPKLLLPWGYDAPGKDTTPLNDFIKFITDLDVNPGKDGETKSVLIHWNRGNIETGDEAKMLEMKIDSNKYFAHVLDIQEWCQLLWPKGASGNEKHNLREAAETLKIATINQRELDNVEEIARPYVYGAMIHCAGGDSEITLRVFMELVMLKIKDLNDEDEGERKLRDDFCFVGLDFEGGGKTGQGTTESGLSSLLSSCVSASGDYLTSIVNRHAIVWESFNNHISRKAQAGKMDIDQDARATYPRWNFQGGPNSTEKEKFCYFTRYNSLHKVFDISVDTEIVYLKHRAWWIIHQIPGYSRVAAKVEYPTGTAPALLPFRACNHTHHEIPSNRPMRAPEEEEEYSM
ncbi:hypothetical protein KCU62_g1613, partial [Aureobasidium sp. EXF-3399]